MESYLIFVVIVAALIGLFAGWTVAWRVIQRQVRIRRQALVQGAAAARKNAPAESNMVARAELELERTKALREAAASAAEQRALVSHLEGKLRIAQMDIDRLEKAAERRHASENDTDSGSGFAHTQPFVG